MDINIYIITHKRIQPIHDTNVYKVLLVGAYNKPEIKEYLRDNSGSENISNKNQNYCELTGMYWMWKNTNAEIIGLCHYRRFFSKLKHIYLPLSDKQIEHILTKYDIILPVKENNAYCGINAKDFFIQQHGKDVWEKCQEIINRLYPSYYADFCWFESETTGFCFNMLITKREIFNEYCEWLFAILFELEKEVDLSIMSSYNQRMYGFVAERLINVWVHHKELRIKEMPVFMIGNSTLQRKTKNLSNKIKHYFVSKTK